MDEEGDGIEFSDPNGFYKRLNANPSNSISQITAEYHSLSLLFHPDRKKEVSSEQTLINEAYNVLGNPKRRAIYDRYRLLNIGVSWEEFEREWSARVSHWMDQELKASITCNDGSEKMPTSSKRGDFDDRVIEELFRKHRI